MTRNVLGRYAERTLHFDKAVTNAMQMRLRDAGLTDVEIRTHLDAITREVVFNFEQTQHGIKDNTHVIASQGYPVTWWDHFKQRWFPKWLEKRFPVKLDYVKVNVRESFSVCPHVNLPPGNRKHITFLDAGNTSDDWKGDAVKTERALNELCRQAEGYGPHVVGLLKSLGLWRGTDA